MKVIRRASITALASFPANMEENRDELLKKDLLDPLHMGDKDLLWKARSNLQDNPDCLPLLMRCVDFFNLQQRLEVLILLANWPRVQKISSCLQLLHYRFADYSVRKWAVDCLVNMPPDDIGQFMIQLVQAIKFEPYHDSPLVR